MIHSAAHPTVDSRLHIEAMGAGRLSLRLLGDWTRNSASPTLDALERALTENAPVHGLEFDGSELGAWDSLLVLFVSRVLELARGKEIEVALDALPEGVRKLLALRSAAPLERTPRRTPPGLLERLGAATLRGWRTWVDLLGFAGELARALGRLLRGRAQLRRGDLLLFIQESGIEALPIVSLISILVGMILAFVGAFQLELFGAQVYIANLVGIGMTREMGAMMAAIIMAGRTGAAYAAQLGAMQANEEIDALRTLGMAPMEFLVLPRLLALVLMLPLLVAYADLLGVLGGMLVGVSLFDIAPLQYLEQTRTAIDPVDIGIGLFKGLVFGLVVASSGCFEGLRSGRSSAAVGGAATAAVVMSIVGIVVTDSLITLVTTLLRI